MTVTPICFRFYICVQTFITIERIIHIVFTYGPLDELIGSASEEIFLMKYSFDQSCYYNRSLEVYNIKLINIKLFDLQAVV